MEDSQVAAALSTQLAERIGASRYQMWFTSQAQLRVEAGCLTISATSKFVLDWVRTYFAEDIRDCWVAIVGEAATVEFEIGVARSSVTDGQTEAAPAKAKSRTVVRSEKVTEPASAAPQEVSADPPSMRRNASLASYVVGASNEYAFRAAELTSRGRQQASPLVFCGGTGVGKTHLLRGIQQEYRRLHPRAISLYLTAEQFTTSYVEAVRGSGLPSFRQKCRGVQLLAIDDLQFFLGKRRTLEELLYTLDTLMGEGRQIVLASDRNLAELRMLGPELVSRLSGGLVCEMESPEYATRLGIVRQLCVEADITMDDDAAALIATQITTGARELRGALHRIQAMSAAFSEPITRALVARALAELARHSTRNVRLVDVQKVVCDAFGVEPAQLRSDRKGRSVSEPRMVAMWLARKYTRAPWSEIGQFFGRQSHSTVISAHRRVEKLIAQQGQIGMADQSCHVDDAIRRLETALRTA